MIISNYVCTIHSNRVVGSFKTTAQLKKKDDPSVQAQKATQNLAQQQHVRNGTGANMVGRNTPTDGNQENEITNVRTDFTLEEEGHIQQLAKDIRSTGSGNEGKDHCSNTSITCTTTQQL